MSEGLRVRDVGTGSRVTTPLTQGGCKAQCWISCARPQAMQLTEFYLCCCCSCAQPGLLRQLWCLGPKALGKSGLGKEEAVVWQLSSLGEPEPAERGTTLPSCSSAPNLVNEERFYWLTSYFFFYYYFSFYKPQLSCDSQMVLYSHWFADTTQVLLLLVRTYEIHYWAHAA